MTPEERNQALKHIGAIVPKVVFERFIMVLTQVSERNNNSLDISYSAETDKATYINMTNHSYFNLNGDPNQNIENCILYVNSYYYTPTDATYMTTGEKTWVKDTPMSFLEPTEIGKNVNNFNFEPIKNANGFDHNWCLETYRDGKGNDKQLAASLYSPTTGIIISKQASMAISFIKARRKVLFSLHLQVWSC